MGDPGGVGPEVCLKALAKHRPRANRSIVLIGEKSCLDYCARRLKINLNLPFLTRSALNFKSCHIYFYDVNQSAGADSRFEVNRVGKVDKRNAMAALQSLETAVEWSRQGIVQAVVTAPVNKTAMRLVLPGFHGHTEFLAEKSKMRSYAMMFVSDRLKVTLVTIHEAIRRVPELIQKQAVYEKIVLTHDALKKRFNIKNPKMAVCALNPHGKETGTEEVTHIEPAVRKARKSGINVAGPFSADQLFHEAYHGRYDALISMYHDQALAPFKMMFFHDGINMTLGLPFVRTSPDHGTAYDIAYQNKADARSMVASLRLAEKLI